MTPVWVIPSMLASPRPLRMLRTVNRARTTPKHRSRPTEDAHPSEQDHRDDVQLIGLAKSPLDRTDAGGEKDPGQPGHGSGGDEQPHLHRSTSMPENRGHIGAVADDVDLPTEGTALEDDPGQGKANEEEHEGDRERPEQGLLADPLEPFREVPDGPVLEKDTCRPRNPISPARVTTSEGSPNRVMTRPWRSPARAPATMPIRMARTNATWPPCRAWPSPPPRNP